MLQRALPKAALVALLFALDGTTSTASASQQPPSSSSSSLALSQACEFESLAHNKAVASLLCMGSLKAPMLEPNESQRPGMDIVAVLDRSGSMSGAKMQTLHKTVNLMIDNLKAADRLSLVAYDDNVETHLQLTSMDAAGKERARTALAGIRDRGMTNLSGGLLAGIDVLRQRESDKNEVASVLLLTDGLANRGITQPDEVVAAATAALQALPNPATLYTFAIGSDHDPNLLRGIAGCGGGTFYFIENADSIPQAFADCLGGLMSVVAQNIRLILTAADGVAINAVHTTFRVDEMEKGRRYVVNVGDVLSEEQRDVLVDVAVPAVDAPTDLHALVSVQLEAVNVIESVLERAEVAIAVKRTGKDTPDGASNPKVDEQRNRIQTAKAMDEARKLGDSGNVEGARAALLQRRDHIAQSASAPQCAALMQDIDNVVSQMQSHEQYVAVGGKKLHAKAHKHWVQRSAECEEEEVEMYSNSIKDKMKSLFKFS